MLLILYCLLDWVLSTHWAPSANWALDVWIVALLYHLPRCHLLWSCGKNLIAFLGVRPVHFGADQITLTAPAMFTLSRRKSSYFISAQGFIAFSRCKVLLLFLGVRFYYFTRRKVLLLFVGASLITARRLVWWIRAVARLVCNSLTLHP